MSGEDLKALQFPEILQLFLHDFRICREQESPPAKPFLFNNGLYPLKVGVEMLNTVKNDLADVSSVNSSSEQNG